MNDTPEYGHEQLAAMLFRGAELTSNTDQAAVYLVVHSGIDLATAYANKAIEVFDRPDPASVDGGGHVTIASIVGWDQLGYRQPGISGSAHALLAVAKSLAGGLVDLSNKLPYMWGQHAQLVAQAMLIAAGHERTYTVVTWPAAETGPVAR